MAMSKSRRSNKGERANPKTTACGLVDVGDVDGHRQPDAGAPMSYGNAGVVDMPIRDIVIGDRCRKDLGDVDEFAESLKDFGMLQAATAKKPNA
jgi:hypothetical protein